MKTIILAGMALALLGGAAASAQEFQDDTVNMLEQKLDGRIDQGVRRGTLTWDEAQTLKDQWRAIVQEEADFRKSGGIDETERQILIQQLQDLNDSIVDEKFDSDVNSNRTR